MESDSATATARVPSGDADPVRRMDTDTVQFYLEELKILGRLMADIDKRVAQVYGFTMAAFVSLFTWIAKYVLGIEDPSLLVSYASLMPDLILLSAFYYLVAQRRDTASFAAYVWLLELRFGAGGYQTGLGHGEGSIRATRRGESNDPIPYFFWALFLISGAFFAHTLHRAAESLLHLAFLIVPAGLLVYCHWEWQYIIPNVLPRLKRRWEEWERRRMVL